MLLHNYGFIGILTAVAVAFPFIALGFAWILRPKKPGPIKQSIYECGLESTGDSWIQYKVQYYIFALIFTVFDIETVFLYPWAVAYNQLGLFALIEVAIFIGILLVALLYAWRKGVLEWV